MSKDVRDVSGKLLKGKRPEIKKPEQEKPSVQASPEEPRKIQVTSDNAPVLAVQFLQIIAKQNSTMLVQNNKIIEILEGVKDV